MTAHNGNYSMREVFPRRSKGLPPGQRLAKAMPRFGSRPTSPPPPIPPTPSITVSGSVEAAIVLDATSLQPVPRTTIVADFHCVTTWTVQNLRWEGWLLSDIWEQVIAPEASPVAETTHLKVRGADGYWAVFDLDDALGRDVILADTLDGRALSAEHGAPLRLVSPQQYGYKSVKHVVEIRAYYGPPRRFGGSIEHPRARVALEERHATIPGRLLRMPYRALILPTAALARRSARRAS